MEEIDIKKLEHMFIRTDALYTAQQQVIDNLVRENEHLRNLIQIIVTNQKIS